MARKRKYIDRKLMKTLAQCQLTNEEIALALRVSHDTIERRYACAIKAWKKTGVASVRRKFFVKATEGDTSCMIFFLKNFANMTDNAEGNKRLNYDGLPAPNDEPVTTHKPN